MSTSTRKRKTPTLSSSPIASPIASSAAEGKGVMAILSPAKTLDLSTPIEHTIVPTEPDCDADKTAKITKIMKGKSEAQLTKLLGISAKLAKIAHGYWANADGQQKPAIFCFAGVAYDGLQAYECSQASIDYLQHHLRIIDPLYGVLRPFDNMKPYRLEMATKNVFAPKESDLQLAQFWSDSVTKRLGEDMKDEGVTFLLNLASDEYSKAVDPSQLVGGTDFRIIKVNFWQEGRTIAVHAKRARGLMVRHLADHNVSTLDQVKKFREEGYSFVPDASNDDTLTFDRPKPSTTSARSSATKKPKTSSKTKTSITKKQREKRDNEESKVGSEARTRTKRTSKRTRSK